MAKSFDILIESVGIVQDFLIESVKIVQECLAFFSLPQTGYDRI